MSAINIPPNTILLSRNLVDLGIGGKPSLLHRIGQPYSWLIPK